MMALTAAPTGNKTAHKLPSASCQARVLISSETVASSALDRLHQSPYRGLRSVGLDVSGNTMVLTGEVRTFFLKQMAQHLLGEFCGTWEIRNNLRVA
jgi:hypothetical protein